MLATISASAPSAGRDVCGSGSRLSHSMQKPRSFLIRDILGKCNESNSSDSDDHNEGEKPRFFFHEKERNSSEDDQDKRCHSDNTASPLPTLCCRECITNDGLRKSDSHEHTPFLTSKNEHCSNEEHCNQIEIRDSKIIQNTAESVSPKIAPNFTFPGAEKHHGTTNHLRTSDCRSFLHHNNNEVQNSKLEKDISNTVLKRFDISQRIPSNQDHSSSSDEEGNKKQDNQGHTSASNRLSHEQGQLHRSVIHKLKEAQLYNQKNFYSGLYPSAQNLIDLNYALNLRAASAFGIPQLALPLLSAYRNSLHTADPYPLSKPVQNTDLRLSESHGARYDPYPRYRLLDWPQNRHASSRESGFTNPNKREPFVVNDQCKDQASAFSDSPRSDHRSYSLHPSSPSYSDQSEPSPLPDNRPIQLPAYFRSRLGGAISTEETNGGKSKKCRRSRTVFTELQMLGLEKRFEKQQYLSTPDRVELAELLGLTQLQVKTWYQNRRMKWKKQVMQGGGTEPPTKPKGRPRKVRPGEQVESSTPLYEANKFSNNSRVLDLRSCVVNSMQDK